MVAKPYLGAQRLGFHLYTGAFETECTDAGLRQSVSWGCEDGSDLIEGGLHGCNSFAECIGKYCV